MRILLVLFVSTLILNIGSAQKVSSIMKFDIETYDLGPIKRGEKRTFKYTFENTGKEDIIIDLVSGCDCTTLEWPRLPINPGDKGSIDVIFDSTEKEDSEPVDIDIYLKNINPETGHPYLKILNYTFTLQG